MSCDTQGVGIQVSDLGWGPDAARFLIRDVSFALKAGDRLAIIGPNGAGKTTLLRCLYRGLMPREGRVHIEGEDIWQMQARRVAQKVGVVLQEMPADFPFNVRDVVMMGRIPWRTGLSGWTAEDRDQVDHALEHLSLADMGKRQFSTLSGGEKQRVLVARALAQQPQIIILDEPTNHLDIRHQLEILDLLGRLKLTIITTLHDINLATDFATHVGLMNAGSLTAFGDPKSVLTEKLLSRTFGVTADHRADDHGRLSGFTFSLAAS